MSAPETVGRRSTPDTPETLQRARKASWIPAVLLVVFEIALVGFLSWRAAAPNNRRQGGLDFLVVRTSHDASYLPVDTHVYDDALTRVTAHNFARDGFSRTHGLPNRRGAPRVSLYDFTRTQCERLAPTTRSLMERNAFGDQVDDISAIDDCIHLHYPPLADWIFGAMACGELDRILDFKLLSILLNAGFLLLAYTWLRREVRSLAALVATALLGTLPAFLEWADALYFHPFQFVFLMGGVLSWSAYQDRRREGAVHARALLFATWLLFFCEALVSVQLTLFFAIALTGLTLLEDAVSTVADRAKGIGLACTGALAAMMLHLGLCVSLFGWRRVLANASSTLSDRVAHGPAGGLSDLARQVDRTLVPWIVVVAGVVVIILAAKGLAAPIRRLALLGIFLAGGASFILAFPGHAKWHSASLQRLFLPFVAALLAFVTDAVLSTMDALRRRRSRSSSWRWQLAASLAGVLLVAWVALRNAERVRGEVGFVLAKNRYPAPDDLVLGSLDTIHWSEGIPRQQGVLLRPVSGLHDSELPGWSTDFRLLGPAPVHYEIWWLDLVVLRTVRVLVDRQRAPEVERQCFLSTLSGDAFDRWPDTAAVTRADFVPEPGERAPVSPYVWVRYSLPAALRTRALRLTCAGFESLALRRVDASSGGSPP